MKKICIASLRCLAVLLTVIMVMAATMLPAKAYITYSCGHNSGQHSDPLHVRLIGYEIEEQTSSGHYKRPIFATLCPVCGAEIGTERGIGTDYEKHSFDTNGCCKVCGYVTSTNECDHNFNHWGSEFLGWGTPDKENHYRKFELWYRCYWCNELAYTEEVIEPERHKFDANGRCTVCGYTSSSSGSCKHTNKKSEKVGSVSKQYDDKYHETIVTYRDVCADCNAVLSAERKDTNKFDHRFDANGTCFCGYVQAKRPCDHTPTETLKDTKYGKADINGHEVIKTYHYECECKQVSYDEKKTSVGAHDYNRNTCRLCGFEKECEHPDFENVVSTAVEKNPNSASMHIIVTTYAEKCFCGAANPNPVKRTSEACRFIKNTDVQSVHEKQGHQYVDKCECGNEKANGKFKAYVSGCADCKHFYDQCVLSRGNASNIPEKVKELQELLMRSGYDLPYYGADGDFSRETEKAVEKFQKDHGLPVTGVVDEATWNALKNTLNYTDTLSKGNPSNKTHVVKELQELLIKNGYELPYYGADGDFSRETEKAVKKFQKDHGLPETGVVDEATWAMLRNPDGTFETDAPGHGPMEGLTDDNPSHSSAETLPPKADSDDDTEGTPSHAPMEGIDEGEPDHGTMEGIEDDSPSHSLDATLPPKIEDESEVVIDGSFGKASYTAEIGDTLSISVRAGSENANLERVTINVDGSGVDRLASEAISGTEWSGTLSLNCNAYPLNTPGTYTLKLYVSDDAGDPNWAIVDYATLVVNDAPVKPDKPVVNVSIDGNTMTATWNAVDGADRYVYSLYNITDDYRIVQHASANKLAASASLEAGKQYRIAVAAVPASVRDTMTETDMCSWTEVVFEMPIAEEADDMIPAVLSVTTNARSRTLLPGDPFTAAVVCNKYTSSLRVSGVENGYISNTYVDEEGRSCFAYTGSFTHNGVYQIRFTAVDPMGVYVENQTYSVVVPVTVCDHTVGEPVLVSEGKAEYANNDEHLIVCTYEKACICREIVENFPDNVLKAHVLSKSCAYDLEHKDGLGHRKYYVCSVCNGDSFSGGDHPGKDDYSEYEEDLGKSGRCAVCQDKYNEKQRIMEAQTLLQGLGYNIGAAGADGVLGTDTLAALNAFRADVMGLGAIGYVDNDTLEALRTGINKNNEQEIPLEQENSTLQDSLKDEKQAIMNDSVDLLEDMANGKNSIYDQFFTDELRNDIEKLSEGLAAQTYDFIAGDAAALISTAQADYYVDTLMKQCAGINSDSKTISISPEDFSMLCNFIGLDDAIFNKILEKWTEKRWTDKYGNVIQEKTPYFTKINIKKDDFQKEMEKYEFKGFEYLGNGIDIGSYLWDCLYDYHVYTTAFDGATSIMIDSAYNNMKESDLYASELASLYIKSCETVEGRISYIMLKNANIVDFARDKAFDAMLYDPSFKLAYEGATLVNDFMFGTTDMLEANHGTYWSMQIVEELHTELNSCIDRYKYEPSEDNYNDCLGTYSLYMTYLISAYNGVLDSIEIYSSSLAANMFGDGLTDKEKALVEQMRMFMDWYADDIEYALENHTVEAIMDRLRLEAMSE